MKKHEYVRNGLHGFCRKCGDNKWADCHGLDESDALQEKAFEQIPSFAVDGTFTPTTKLTNPKDTVGSTKPPASTVPLRVLALLGVAMLEGTLKYGRHNYRDAGVRASVYYDAARRHMDKWFEGEDIDPDSGLPHIVKAMASLVVLQDGILEASFNDDRPPKIDSKFWLELEEQTKQILAKFPNPVPAFTEKGRQR